MSLRHVLICFDASSGSMLAQSFCVWGSYLLRRYLYLSQQHAGFKLQCRQDRHGPWNAVDTALMNGWIRFSTLTLL